MQLFLRIAFKELWCANTGIYQRGTTEIMFCYQTDGPITKAGLISRGGGGGEGEL